MNTILIDVGSSTIKTYKNTKQGVQILLQRSIAFKDGFDPEGGISSETKKELFELIDSIKEQNKNSKIKIFATGIFRKLTKETKTVFIDEFLDKLAYILIS